MLAARAAPAELGRRFKGDGNEEMGMGMGYGNEGEFLGPSKDEETRTDGKRLEGDHRIARAEEGAIQGQLEESEMHVPPST